MNIYYYDTKKIEHKTTELGLSNIKTQEYRLINPSSFHIFADLQLNYDKYIDNLNDWDYSKNEYYIYSFITCWLIFCF